MTPVADEITDAPPWRAEKRLKFTIAPYQRPSSLIWLREDRFTKTDPA